MPFPEEERCWLLRVPGIGGGVIRRLEAAGFESLESLRRAGIDCIVQTVCGQVGSAAWANRRRAIERALDTTAGHSAPRAM